MKRFFIAAVFLATATFNSAQTKDTTLILEGIYSGKNLFIKNSYGPGGIGFCVTEVKVNGQTTKDEINGNIFQIRLDAFKLKKGDKVKTEIRCHKNCGPLPLPCVMNPADLTSDPGSTSFILEGVFMWQNLFIVNPRSSDKNYSITEIKVNGKIISAALNSDLIEINLNRLGLNDKEKLKVEFKHKKLLAPIIINPEAIH